jgi:hypothetical protein
METIPKYSKMPTSNVVRRTARLDVERACEIGCLPPNLAKKTISGLLREARQTGDCKLLMEDVFGLSHKLLRVTDRLTSFEGPEEFLLRGWARALILALIRFHV